MNKLPSLIVLTGKTASGKDAVMSKLLLRLPNLGRVITTTSRLPREGEKDGIDYNFISEADFKQKIEQGEFIEWVEYGGNLYGTQKAELLDNSGSDLIWRIDPSRAGQIREFIKASFDPSLVPDLLKRVLVIYLTTPDIVVLKRLQERGLGKEEIETRMGEDSKFWQEYKDNYEYVVENVPGHLDETVDKIINILENHFS